MADEKNKDYNLDDFDNNVKFTPNPEKIDKNKVDKVDYGDDFDTQTGENNEVQNPDEYYVSRPRSKNKKKEKKRKIKNAAIIACIAVVCILVVFAFALTQCSMPKIKLSVTTAPTLPTITKETTAPQEETYQPTKEITYAEETTVISEETTAEKITQVVTEEVTEPLIDVTEEVTQAVETEPVTEEITELPDPEVEQYGQDQDY